jgi:hypothetical protein
MWWLAIYHRILWIYLLDAALLTVQGVALGVVQVASTVASVACIIAIMEAGRMHGLSLCPKCADEMPADGQARAQRRRRRLRAAHLSSSGVIVFPIIVATLAVELVFPHLRFPWPLIALVAFLAGQYVLMSVHRPLQPWCPWCHWGDGGHEESVPDPVPPSAIKVG